MKFKPADVITLTAYIVGAGIITHYCGFIVAIGVYLMILANNLEQEIEDD